MITTRVDYGGVTAMARDLANWSAAPYRKVLLSETASIIKICALRAKPASLAKIKTAIELTADRNFVGADQSVVSINLRAAKGRVWFVPGSMTSSPERATRGAGPVQPGKLRPIVSHGNFLLVYEAGGAKGHHLPDAAWQAYLLAVNDRDGYIKARLKELRSRRGLQLLSWLQIADGLGVPLSTVAPQGSLQESIARAARGPGGRSYANGRVAIDDEGKQLLITVTNGSPLAIKRQGQDELDRAINQRVRGFEIAVRKGVINDLHLRAARWKGIFITP
jgi:hypothetical protein